MSKYEIIANEILSESSFLDLINTKLEYQDCKEAIINKLKKYDKGHKNNGKN